MYYFDSSVPFSIPFPMADFMSYVEKILIRKLLAESGQEQWSLLVEDQVQLFFCSLHFVFNFF